MNWGSWLVWGFAATVVLTTLMASSQGLGLTRMNIPYILGTMFTVDRDRAKALGVLIHLLNGWMFSLVYVAAFHLWGGPTWWKGALIGLVHAGFVLAYVLKGEVMTRISGQGPAKIYKTGEMFFEPPGSVHEESANPSRTEPAQLLAMIFAKKGSTLTTPVSRGDHD